MARTRRKAGRKRRQDVDRKPSGQIRTSVYAERVGATAEVKALRVARLGSHDIQAETDSVLASLASPARLILTERQRRAGEVFQRDRALTLKAVGVSPHPRTPRMEHVDGTPMLNRSNDASDAAHYYRKACKAMRDYSPRCMKAVERVVIDNHEPQTYHIQPLRDGLDVLVKHYRL